MEKSQDEDDFSNEIISEFQFQWTKTIREGIVISLYLFAQRLQSSNLLSILLSQ